MQIVLDHLHAWDSTLPQVLLRIDRHTLAKRHWRGTADDGADFGFQLEHPLADRDVFFVAPHAFYAISQKPEPVLEITLGAHPEQAARLGWIIGNLHFPVQIAGKVLRVADDLALRQLFEREKIPFTSRAEVFAPLGGGHSHEHHHHH